MMIRKLYPEEISHVKDIFKDSIDYDKVRVTKGHLFSKGATRTVGNVIHFPVESFYPDQDKLLPENLQTLSHELVHIWQYQNGGWAYAFESLAKQAAGFYSTGSRNTAYDWKTAVEWSIPWEDWGPEQQAAAIEEWGVANRSGNSALSSQLLPYVDKVRSRKGAAQFSPAGAVVSVSVGAGIGYLIRKRSGAQIGGLIGLLLNFPWNSWLRKKNG